MQNKGRTNEQIVQEFCHEIRTPLAALVAIGALLDSDLKDIQNNALAQITMILKHAETQLHQISPPSRLTLIQPEQVVEEAVELLRVVQPGRTVRIVAETKRSLLVNREAVIQILGNLLENAFRYSPVNKDIVITLKEIAGKTAINVTDGGPGVNPDMHELIFDEGFTTNKDQRQGIGLTLSRRRARAMGGTLTSNQSTNGGSFTLTLDHQE